MALLNQDRKPGPPPTDPNYPCWRYHKDKPEGVLVRNAEQEMNLGEGWSHVPPPPAPPAATKPTYDDLESRLRDLQGKYDKLLDEHTELLLQNKADRQTKKAQTKPATAPATTASTE